MATEVVVDEVANNLEEASRAVRALNSGSAGYILGGICIGLGIGFVLGQKWRRKQIAEQIFKQSEEEINQIREYYARNDKPDLEEVVQERGYAVEEEEERPLPPPVPVNPAQRVHRTEEAEKDKYEGWSYPFELSQRNWKGPHIIHQDEFFSAESEMIQTTYVYYEGDDKLTDTDNTVLNNRETLVGRDALMKFGHGTDDSNIVYVRNPAIELEIEIIRHNGTYAEEVQGLEREEEDEDDGSEPTEG